MSASVILVRMSDVTRILHQIETGDPSAAEKLLPLVYDELRKLAAANMAREAPGHSLQATSLVHEAYIRLVDVDQAQHWNSRGHFFGAAAQAMRRILVDAARQRKSEKRGGGWQRIPLEQVDALQNATPDELLILDEALQELANEDSLGARLVELRYFAGLSVEEAAGLLGISAATGYRHWSFARAWLHSQIAAAK